jgi:hypothetical protein
LNQSPHGDSTASDALAKGRLPAPTREHIARVVAQLNGCSAVPRRDPPPMPTLSAWRGTFARLECPSSTGAFMKATLLAALLCLGTGAAQAHNCPNEMKAIDAKLATHPTPAATDMDMVRKLRADGEAFHKVGKHGESMKALGDAKKLLGI